MKKCLCALLALVFLCLPALAAPQERVFDQAGLFTPSEAERLTTLVDQVKESTHMDIVLVTTNDAQGKSAREYADDYYEGNDFGQGSRKSGALFLIDMDNREIYLSTCGDMIDYLTDARIDRILDDAFSHMTDGDYAGAATAALKGIEKYVGQGIPDGAYRYDTETGKITRYRSIKPIEICIALAAALLAAIIPCFVIVGRYRKHAQDYAYPYREKGKLTLTQKQDVFLHQTVTRHRIDTSSGGHGGSSGSGGSSTHHSSSGSTHGGGGRSF